MRPFVVLAALWVSACAAPQAVLPPPATVEPAAYAAPIPPEAPLLPATPPGFREALAAAGSDLDVPAAGKAIVVNIPSFELVALEDGVEVMRSRVIVGKRSQPTPRMRTETTVVRFRPSWRPTPSMVATGAYEDEPVPPGRGNPLGLAAIRLAQGDLIYLHGTNNPKLFDREMRALSWGCVRVEKLEPLIAWLLDVDEAQVAGMTGGRRTFDAGTDGIAVIIAYETRFPDATGAAVEHADVYGLGATRVASN